MNRLIILVVIYKMLPKNSATLRSLADSRAWLVANGHHIIVHDNSPEMLSAEQQTQLKEMLADCTITYQHDGRNLGLSQIYNGVIRQFVTKHDFLLLLDHDTTFDVGLLKAFATAQHEYPKIDLFLPIIRSGADIVSPSYQHLFKGTYWREPRQGVIPSRRVTAINSAMFIAGRYLCGQFEGYDERMTFYGTDNYFMWRYTQHHDTLCVLDYTVHHVLNFYAEDEPVENKVRRLRAMRKAGLLLERLRYPWLYPLVYCYWDLFSIKCAIKQRSAKFLFVR